MCISSVQIHQENWWKNHRIHYVVSYSPSCGSCSEYMMALGKASTDTSRSTTFSLVVIFFLLLNAFPSTPATTNKIKCGHKQGSRKEGPRAVRAPHPYNENKFLTNSQARFVIIVLETSVPAGKKRHRQWQCFSLIIQQCTRQGRRS